MKVDENFLESILQKTTKETNSLALLFSADLYLNRFGDLKTSKAYFETVLLLEKENTFATKSLQEIEEKSPKEKKKPSLTDLFKNIKLN
jgi:hypothetical protein